MTERHYALRQVFCSGEPCVFCGLCETCGRVIEPIHLTVCACPDNRSHTYCERHA